MLIIHAGVKRKLEDRGLSDAVAEHNAVCDWRLEG